MCKYCRHYKINTAKSQIQPVLVVKIIGVKAQCTICGQDIEADFEEYKLHRLGKPATPSNRMKVVFQEINEEEES